MIQNKLNFVIAGQRLRQFAVIVCLLLASAAANGQGFPYDDFLPRTLKQIIEENIATQNATQKYATSPTQIIIDADPLPSVVRMIYSGKTRPLGESRLNYLKLWLQSTAKKPDFINLYNQEMLFSEEGTEYWLPIQTQLIPYFRKEIAEGRPVDVYLIRMGGQLLPEKDWDWMFIVEEFRKPGSERDGVFPWNDFEPRSLQKLIELSLKDDSGSSLTRNPKYLFRDQIMSSKVRMTYTGESRALKDDRRKFISDWAEAVGADPAYGVLYERELLFRENNSEHWIPVAKMIIPRIERDTKKGDPIDLYLVRLGGMKYDEKIEWIFLVEEFQKVKQ